MSKSRRPSSRRAASAASRKPVRRAPKAAKKGKRKPPRRSGGVELKPIRDQIVAAVAALSTFEQTDGIKITIERLDRCLVEFDAICDKESGNCGTTMAFWP